jgi:hypothetical protein
MQKYGPGMPGDSNGLLGGDTTEPQRGKVTRIVILTGLSQKFTLFKGTWVLRRPIALWKAYSPRKGQGPLKGLQGPLESHMAL